MQFVDMDLARAIQAERREMAARARVTKALASWCAECGASVKHSRWDAHAARQTDLLSDELHRQGTLKHAAASVLTGCIVTCVLLIASIHGIALGLQG
jgi:hypothetical protein